jgi:hypothetical protein
MTCMQGTPFAEVTTEDTPQPVTHPTTKAYHLLTDTDRQTETNKFKQPCMCVVVQGRMVVPYTQPEQRTPKHNTNSPQPACQPAIPVPRMLRLHTGHHATHLVVRAQVVTAAMLEIMHIASAEVGSHHPNKDHNKTTLPIAKILLPCLTPPGKADKIFEKHPVNSHPLGRGHYSWSMPTPFSQTVHRTTRIAQRTATQQPQKRQSTTRAKTRRHDTDETAGQCRSWYGCACDLPGEQ